MSTEKKTTPADKAKRRSSPRASTTKRVPQKSSSAVSKLFCTNCGHELSTDDKFCGGCGTKVAHETTPEVPDETVQDVPLVKPELPQTDSAQVGEWPAFVEMWHFIKQLPLTPSREEKRELRCQAKKRMYKAPILSIACPVTTFVLFLLSLLLATAGGIKFFFAPMLVFLLATTVLLVLFLSIYFTKLNDVEEIKKTIEPNQTSDVKPNKPKTGKIGWCVRILVWIFALLCLIMVFRLLNREYGLSPSRLFSGFTRHSRMPTAAERQLAETLQAQANKENVSDYDCIQEIDIAIMNDDYRLARQWANRIKDDRTRRFRLAQIQNLEDIWFKTKTKSW